MTDTLKPRTAAEALLMRLKAQGVDYLFANGGTDFPPIIEAFANGATSNRPMPEPLVITHETVAVGMAHGYYQVTGRPQAVMFHVNVGLANAVMGMINAASDNVPLFVMTGRTPLTEHGREGARITPIQYGQEMRDQGGIVREICKWDYEMHYPEQAVYLVDRARSISMAEPRGPVYLSLPREPLADRWPDDLDFDPPIPAVPSAPAPDETAVARAAELLAGAKHPLLICQRGDPEGRLAGEIATFAEDNAVPVVEFWGIQNMLPTSHPMHAGFDVGPWIDGADVILVVNAQVPWIQRNHHPAENARIIHVGADPLFQAMPVRSFRNDLSITGDPAATVKALGAALAPKRGDVSGRRAAIEKRTKERRDSAVTAAAKGNGSPMSPAFVSQCLSKVIDDDTVIFNELGVSAPFMEIRRANQFFTPPFSGGLGWGFPSVLGAALANRDRLNIACVGDGSYTFANPVACHQVAEALELPVLVIVFNNGVWNAVRRQTLNMYPDGTAAKMNTMPITALTPNPDYQMIAGASRGWAERVETGADLPAALERAIDVVRNEKRQALLEVRVSY